MPPLCMQPCAMCKHAFLRSHHLLLAIAANLYYALLYYTTLQITRSRSIWLWSSMHAFDDMEHSVVPCPHGNSKKSDSYIRTMPSTLHKLKKVAVNLTPKFAVFEVSGDVSAPSAGSLVRNR